MNVIRLGGMKPVLSILVCTIASRREFLTALLKAFMPQIGVKVELIIASDDGEVSIGEKRNRLLDEAWGEYVCFFDDDDKPSPDYSMRILQALKSKPDCVGFKVRRTVDGVPDGESIHTMRFERNGNFIVPGKSSRYERVPNHLNPVRVELARQVGFKPWNMGEDTDYGARLRPMLQREEFIDAVLYHYDYRTDRQHEITNKPMMCATPIPPPMDAVIVSDSTHPHLRAMTATTIRTLKQTVPHVNVIVVESSDTYWPGCVNVRPDVPFNYNAYLMLGAAAGSAPWVGLFNNDLVFRPGWWLKILQAHARTGITSFSPRCPNDHRQGLLPDIELMEGCRVGYELSGWAIVVQRETLDKIGGLNTQHTFWYSDDAYAEQLLNANVKHALVCDAIVNHRGSCTIATKSEREKAALMDAEGCAA